jgi:hypothetical protein
MIEKINWIDPVRNEEILHRITEEKDILRSVKIRKDKCICHIIHRNCPLKYVIEGKVEGRIEVTGRRGGRRKQLLNDFKERRRHCKLKQAALDRIVWTVGLSEDRLRND